jgi:hypothetical protein
MNTANKHLSEILKIKSKFFVDIGCSDSTEYSQSEILIDHNWSGLMFEYNEDKWRNQNDKIQNDNVKVVHAKITPDNVIDILISNGCIDDFFLTLDIDGYDYFVLEQILSVYKPSLIISEINEKIPPNIKFSVQYSKDYWWDSSHFYGYSLSMLEDLLLKHQYKILDLDYNNVVLIKGEQVDKLDEVYYNGYLHNADRARKFPYNHDFEEIYQLPLEEQVEFLKQKFHTHEGQYILSWK